MVRRIKDKHGETVFDLLRDDDTEIRQLMRKARAQNSVSHADIANGTLAPPTLVLCTASYSCR